MDRLGIIGGSGLYEIEGLSDKEWRKVESSFGEASDELLFGNLDGQDMVFLPRHGRGHRIPPSEINFRANIDSLKRSGVTRIISVSAVGSLRENLPPGTFVIIDQFIDRTVSRVKSFFGTGMVAHVGMGNPVCSDLGDALEQAAIDTSVPYHRNGTYLAMEGPQFSTKAESNLYRSWDCDVIGMTNMPEASLAREAEICYASVAMVTDFDCWHPDHDHVTLDAIIATLYSNADKAKSLVRRASAIIREKSRLCPQGCHRSLENAIVTSHKMRDPALVKKLDAIAGRVLNQKS